MATVATVVINGKCQNSHTMVVAERVKIAKRAAIFVLTCDDESVMPASPQNPMPRTPVPLYPRTLIQVALLNDHIVKTPTGGLVLAPKKTYPSMVSRRQCHAVNTMSTSATPSDAAPDTHTSDTAIGSSLSTLVINKCWLKDGMNIKALLVFSE